MKTKRIMMVLAIVAISTGIFAQPCPQGKSLTPEQKVELKKVHDTYAPKMTELKQEMKALSVGQKVLLSSKVIDETKVFQNIDKMGELKTAMQKEMLSMHKDKAEIAPELSKKNKKGMKGQCPDSKKGPKMGEGQRQGKGNGQGQMRAQADCQKGQGKATCSADQKGQKGAQAKKGNAPQKGMKKGEQPKQQMAKGMNFTEEQKEAMKAIKVAHFWEIQETQNAIALLMVDNVTVDDKMKNLDKLGTLQTQLAKQKMKMKLETINLMTEEQRMKAVAMHKGQKPQRGGQHRR